MPTPKSKPVCQLDRVHICARITALRDALIPCGTSAPSMGEPFACIGRAEVQLIDLEERLREMDRGARSALAAARDPPRGGARVVGAQACASKQRSPVSSSAACGLT